MSLYSSAYFVGGVCLFRKWLQNYPNLNCAYAQSYSELSPLEEPIDLGSDDCRPSTSRKRPSSSYPPPPPPKRPAGDPSQNWPKWDYNWDKLKETTDASRTLIFVCNTKGGRTGKLSPEEISSIEEVADYLLAQTMEEPNPRLDSLTSDTSKSSIETAERLYQRLSSQFQLRRSRSDLLNKGYPITPEPNLQEESSVSDTIMFQKSLGVEAAFRHFFYRLSTGSSVNTREVYVCHSKMVQYFLMRVLQMPAQCYCRYNLSPLSLTVFKIQPNGTCFCQTAGERVYYRPESCGDSSRHTTKRKVKC